MTSIIITLRVVASAIESVGVTPAPGQNPSFPDTTLRSTACTSVLGPSSASGILRRSRWSSYTWVSLSVSQGHCVLVTVHTISYRLRLQEV